MTDFDNQECIVCGARTDDNLILGNGDNVPICPSWHDSDAILDALQDMSGGDSSTTDNGRSDTKGKSGKGLSHGLSRGVEPLMPDPDAEIKRTPYINPDTGKPELSDDTKAYTNNHNLEEGTSLFAVETIQQTIEKVDSLEELKEVFSDAS